MLDKRSLLVLKVLNKLADSNAYKVLTGEEIISNISQKSQFDLDSIKQIMDFLEKQEYINIKFSEDSTYCYSLLPKARIYLEQESSKSKSKKNEFNTKTYLLIFLSSFIGAMIAMLIFFYLTF